MSGETTFAEIASKESDCNSARRGGDLGLFGRGQMQSKSPYLCYFWTPKWPQGPLSVTGSDNRVPFLKYNFRSVYCVLKKYGPFILWGRNYGKTVIFYMEQHEFDITTS